jgi:hypothetical protein
MRHPSGFDLLTGDDFPKPLHDNVWSKFIMPFLGSLSATDLQGLPFSGRELPGKLLAIGVLLLLPKPKPQPQPKSSYPSSEFNIGDLVAYDWEPEDDDAPESVTDFGEIMGMRWVPEPDGYCFVGNTWIYYIRWTHSTYPDILLEPCYDGEPTLSSDLRLVKQFQGVE